ncbi:POTRA domain-containing protein [uncultured Tenacibaculum sp.]|uniref:POTRA domain-containing protein n=1 Tax=uncultured Tenacibaculum sp. TaxID=174713 RepID=UPI002619F500|nr:POTRA domain-containing protein [uncultured Tenacibaculum sp.]
MKQIIFFLATILLFSNNFVFSQNNKVKFINDKKNEKHTLKKNNLDRAYYFTDLSKSLDSVSQNLKLKGYFYNRYDSIITSKEQTSVHITFGKKIDSIRIFHRNKSVEVIEISKLKNYLDNKNSILASEGKIFSKAELKNITLEDNIISASLVISDSKKRTIDKIVIKGYTEFPKTYLKHYLKLKTQSTFSPEKIETISQEINGLNFIEQQKSPETLFSKDSTIVYLYLKKVKNSSFDGLINFSSSEREDLSINGNINFELNNLINTGEQLHINWNANGNERQNLVLRTFIPYIFKSPISNNSSFEIYRQDSSFLSSKFNTELTYDISPKMKAGLKFESLNSNNTLDSNNQINSNTVDFSSSFVGPSFSYRTNTRNTFLKPKFSIQFNTLFGNRESENNNANQIKTNLESNFNFKISQRSIIDIRNETSILTSSSEILFNELYRIGGINSIRGFDPQSIFSSQYSFFNIEYIYLTSQQKSYLYSITDIGISEDITKKTNILFGYGFGYAFKRSNTLINLSITSNLSENLNKNRFNLSIIFKNYF